HPARPFAFGLAPAWGTRPKDGVLIDHRDGRVSMGRDFLGPPLNRWPPASGVTGKLPVSELSTPGSPGSFAPGEGSTLPEPPLGGVPQFPLRAKLSSPPP